MSQNFKINRACQNDAPICTAVITSQAPLGALIPRRHDQEVLWRLIRWRCLHFPSHRPTPARLLAVARKTCGVGPLVRPYALQDYLVTPTHDLSLTRASKKNSKMMLPFIRMALFLPRRYRALASRWFKAGSADCQDLNGKPDYNPAC
jgi:hypothetical protein